MTIKPLKIVLVSTPIGCLGSGEGGGVEITLNSLLMGLSGRGHEITLFAPEGSKIPKDLNEVKLKEFKGQSQISWQHQDLDSPILIPFNGVLPRMWEEVLKMGSKVDAVLNFGYDWLPIWITPYVQSNLFHLISMGAESLAMKNVIKNLSDIDHKRLAFHTASQASDYFLNEDPIIVGNGFDLNNYNYQPLSQGPLGWAGRIAPEKGLEDAVAVAYSLNERLLVWGVIEDNEYAKKIEELFPKGTIDWRGFLPTNKFQQEMGACRALLNTPKWNEAYGNVVVEAMACGVPVIAYDRGGPGEIIKTGLNGILVPPDDVQSLIIATKTITQIDRKKCRKWVENSASHHIFAKRIENWIIDGLEAKNKSDFL